MNRYAPHAYAGAWPFPYLVVDDAVSELMLDEAVAAWPDADHPGWETFNGDHERGKRQMAVAPNAPIGRLLGYLSSPYFVRQVELVTGIDGLIVDQDRIGGGLHESGDGAYLDVHTDFNRHPTEGWYRRVNVLLFANRKWSMACGGALVLGEYQLVSIAPAWNRMVIFETTARSFHGHPDPWRGPSPRRSFAVYYYTHEPPADVEPDRGTTWADERTTTNGTPTEG